MKKGGGKNSRSETVGKKTDLRQRAVKIKRMEGEPLFLRLEEIERKTGRRDRVKKKGKYGVSKRS